MTDTQDVIDQIVAAAASLARMCYGGDSMNEAQSRIAANCALGVKRLAEARAWLLDPDGPPHSSELDDAALPG